MVFLSYFRNYRANRTLQKVFKDFRSYYLHTQMKKIHKSLYYGYRNKDLVLLRTTCDFPVYQKLYEMILFNRENPFSNKFHHGKLTKINVFDAKDLPGYNVNSKSSKFRETRFGEIQYQARSTGAHNTTLLFTFQRAFNKDYSFRDWKITKIQSRENNSSVI
ncbi:unnamed protein product [Moneuplotes crassus]|uniref:Uncharacterized protein n=1 Tax=Euplotes crassus TaxID=5936 RepID=A0AAD1XZK1_EUPCR|nr:unnamed protein product [Moneuplotes crassus]